MNYIYHINDAIQKANDNKSKLNGGILGLTGFSGKKGRHLLNNICNLPNVNYFEIGTYQGSTLVSAAYGNIGKFTGYDNFSQFGGLDGLTQNINQYAPHASYLNEDYFNFNLDNIPKDIDIYFYDGPHGYDDHYTALPKILPHCKSEFVFIVDDWNGKNAKDGTLDYLKTNTVNILKQWDIADQTDSDHDGYWCGLGVFLLEKQCHIDY